MLTFANTAFVPGAGATTMEWFTLPRTVSTHREQQRWSLRLSLVAMTHWRRLLDAMGAVPGVAPSDRTLRGIVEPEVFKELARRLVALGSIAPEPDGPLIGLDPLPRSSGRVLVIGAAMMDAIFRTRTIPQHETSEPAHGSRLASSCGPSLDKLLNAQQAIAPGNPGQIGTPPLDRPPLASSVRICAFAKPSTTRIAVRNRHPSS
jgi:hypothetical protein